MTLIARSGYTLVVGIGLTGQSVLAYLLRQGKSLVVYDSRAQPPGLDAFRAQYPDVPLVCGDAEESLFCEADEILLSPGLSKKTPGIAAALAAGVSVIGDVELFARQVTAPVIAITGSNGKSTVTTLVGEMAKAAGLKVVVAGNIGLPVLSALDASADLYVLELSSFQLETTASLKPVAATILNVSPDHMDRYDRLIDYALAKQRIAFGAKTLVVNKEDPLTEPPLAQGVAKRCFTLKTPDLHDYGIHDGFLVRGFTPLIALSEVRLQGRHNYANCLAALALCDAAGIEREACLTALREFSGLDHRCQWVCAIRGVDFINDSKATNVGASLAALEGLGRADKHLHVILGGDGKAADFAPLLPALARFAKSVALIGRDGPQLSALLSAELPQLPRAEVTSLAEAVQWLFEQAVPGDQVLLSPACASLDMFKNYEDRGHQFAVAAKALSVQGQ
jgi:UDP-N-acetylmuramoylalanine--D-glutamate ligase